MAKRASEVSGVSPSRVAFGFSLAAAALVLGCVAGGRSLPNTTRAGCEIARQPEDAPERLLVRLADAPRGGSELLADLPCTISIDGRRLQAVVLGSGEVSAGSLTMVQALGVLRLTEGNAAREILLVAPVGAALPLTDEIRARALGLVTSRSRSPSSVRLREWGDMQDAIECVVNAIAAAAAL
jgi:hypothetical protein